MVRFGTATRRGMRWFLMDREGHHCVTVRSNVCICVLCTYVCVNEGRNVRERKKKEIMNERMLAIKTKSSLRWNKERQKYM